MTTVNFVFTHTHLTQNLQYDNYTKVTEFKNNEKLRWLRKIIKWILECYCEEMLKMTDKTKKWFVSQKVYSQAGQGKLLKEVYRTRLIPILSS